MLPSPVDRTRSSPPRTPRSTYVSASPDTTIDATIGNLTNISISTWPSITSAALWRSKLMVRTPSSAVMLYISKSAIDAASTVVVSFKSWKSFNDVPEMVTDPTWYSDGSSSKPDWRNFVQLLTNTRPGPLITMDVMLSSRIAGMVAGYVGVSGLLVNGAIVGLMGVAVVELAKVAIPICLSGVPPPPRTAPGDTTGTPIGVTVVGVTDVDGGAVVVGGARVVVGSTVVARVVAAVVDGFCVVGSTDG
ncbi:hypothetical protein H310_00666 [Aphanomyces invadans]|uniref:Uncharacterized protein n=1 Tax=Aphanomyces invadans TaxID=157072 RepID=A0A024UXE1_9STRA|nr:hypothetical protein H310_00666 [Aphanomyces invadans]ETW10343.1 hypothetical protein H310_00666 [Aphanomyces invadans]|eukprot:XP_008861754.1 hypothetical protein H310_00666 [Aphanomyces invadans]